MLSLLHIECYAWSSHPPEKELKITENSGHFALFAAITQCTGARFKFLKAIVPGQCPNMAGHFFPRFCFLAQPLQHLAGC